MTYRDESQALHDRTASLKSQLNELKTEALDPVTFDGRTARLEHELAQVEAQQRAQPFRAPMLDRLKVATPCTRSWHPDDRRRNQSVPRVLRASMPQG